MLRLAGRLAMGCGAWARFAQSMRGAGDGQNGLTLEQETDHV